MAALRQPDCKRIVVFTDHLASARQSVDPSVHSSQGHSLAVCRTLAPWLEESPDHKIEFIQVFSQIQWDFHQAAHDFCRDLPPIQGRNFETSLDSLRKDATDHAWDSWIDMFQDPKYRGSNFLML
ncbi:hypothetical protein BDN70DRAFT_901010 [Pholiota conissans]|uniref:Uncharacterized protein n=1 Tax=Pholiota conissans TaxID=109636 RepID=A0A9P6CT85_9AGAR|nr:hypothetical protein BDN70DRAFT_901010 [Pholiota conissans]